MAMMLVRIMMEDEVHDNDDEKYANIYADVYESVNVKVCGLVNFSEIRSSNLDICPGLSCARKKKTLTNHQLLSPTSQW